MEGDSQGRNRSGVVVFAASARMVRDTAFVDHDRLRSRDSFINESLEAPGLRRGVQRRPGPGLRILDFRFWIWIAGT